MTPLVESIYQQFSGFEIKKWDITHTSNFEKKDQHIKEKNQKSCT